jgi:hypothetical protein
LPEQFGLTGVWDGQFSYPRRFAPVPFTAVIMETGSSITGSIHERPPDGARAGRTLVASIEGQGQGGSVEFLKTYDEGQGVHGRPIRYTGVLSPDGRTIDGLWALTEAWSGKFVMTRSGGARATARARRRASAPVA